MRDALRELRAALWISARELEALPAFEQQLALARMFAVWMWLGMALLLPSGLVLLAVAIAKGVR